MTTPEAGPPPWGAPSERGFPPPGYGYGQPPPGYGYGQPPGYGYGQPPPGYGYGQPPPGYGYPPVPRGMVLIPGRPPLRAASAGQRLLGRLIDSIGYLILLGGAITGVVFILISAVHASRSSINYNYGYPTSGDPTIGLRFLWIYPILGGVLLVIAAYEWLMVGLRGATLGDRIAGVRFVNTRDGGRPGLGRSAGRTAMFAGGFVVCYGVPTLLLWLSIFFDDSGRLQGWADKACGLQAVTDRTG